MRTSGAASSTAIFPTSGAGERQKGARRREIRPYLQFRTSPVALGESAFPGQISRPAKNQSRASDARRHVGRRSFRFCRRQSRRLALARRSRTHKARPNCVPVPNIGRSALTLEREKDKFLAWLAGNRCFSLSCGEICDTKEARERTLARLCDFLEIRASTFVASIEKMTPPVEELVEHSGELRRVPAIFGVPGLPARG
jgi:hypothetical protein